MYACISVYLSIYQIIYVCMHVCMYMLHVYVYTRVYIGYVQVSAPIALAAVGMLCQGNKDLKTCYHAMVLHFTDQDDDRNAYGGDGNGDAGSNKDGCWYCERLHYASFMITL